MLCRMRIQCGHYSFGLTPTFTSLIWTCSILHNMKTSFIIYCRKREGEAIQLGISVKKLKSTFASIRGPTKKTVTDPLPKMPPTPTGSEDEMSDIEDAMEIGTEDNEKGSQDTQDRSAMEKSKVLTTEDKSSSQNKSSGHGKLPTNENKGDEGQSRDPEQSVPMDKSGDTLKNKYGIELSKDDIVAIPKSASNYDACKIKKIKKKKIYVLFMKIKSDKSLKEPTGGKAYEHFHMNEAIHKFSTSVISEEEHLRVKAKCAEFCNHAK